MLHRRPNSTARQGQVAIFVALSLVAIIGTLAVSLDGGAIMSEHRHTQNAADAAALAAASDLSYNFWSYSGIDSTGTAKSAALAAAAQNGYSNDGTTSTVTVNIPPTSGFYAGRAGYVEVIVQYNQARGFSSLFASGTIPVKARAVAIGMPTAADVGILVLDSSSKDALSLNGGGTFPVIATPLLVHSTDTQA